MPLMMLNILNLSPYLFYSKLNSFAIRNLFSLTFLPFFKFSLIRFNSLFHEPVGRSLDTILETIGQISADTRGSTQVELILR